MESSTFAFGTSCTLTLLSLTGVYGRYGWNHPDPLLYYALTPLSLAAGRAAWATQVGARLLQTVAVAWGAAGTAPPWAAVAELAKLINTHYPEVSLETAPSPKDPDDQLIVTAAHPLKS